MPIQFDYHAAFDRNIGWLTEDEQKKLRQSTVAIAGLGGAGGYQIQALARLGIASFKIADPDTFELTNFNRQIGASINTVGHFKVEVLQEMILRINPEAKVVALKEPVVAENIDSFLDGAELAIDGIDFFEQGAKLLFFQKCRQKRIPAMTSCPLGFGASLLVFSPGGMTYEDYFDLKAGMSDEAVRMNVTYGLSPKPLCLSYMNKKALETQKQRAASVSPGLMLVGALTAAETVNVLLQKAKPKYCPNIFQIDLLTQRVHKKFYPMGMKSPWQRLKRAALFRLMRGQLTQERPS